MPGTFVVQSGQRGAESSLFVRGGDSDDNKILLDGVDAGDLGKQFDFGPLSTTAIESAESLSRPRFEPLRRGRRLERRQPHHPPRHHQLPFPALPGRCRQPLHLARRTAGAQARTKSSTTWAPSVGSKPPTICPTTSTTSPPRRPTWAGLSTATRNFAHTLHYGVGATGVPNAWDFYHVADNATEKDQDIFLSGSIDNQTTASFHNSIRYGLTRKREQDSLWIPSGNLPASYADYCFGPGTFGNTVTITGANGYSATGQAVLDCSTFQRAIRLQPRPDRLSRRYHHHAAPRWPRRLPIPG